jgi:glycosyltransferase involved in cell wall biosynthesis
MATPARQDDRESAGPAPSSVLVIGQTPPPFGGQALMIEALVTAKMDRLRLLHVRLAFSESMQSVGRVEVRKALHLLVVAARTIRLRFRHGPGVLYFSPAGPNLVPVLRDMLLLSLVRPFFPRTVYHFHAAGLSEFLDSKPRWFRSLARAAYGRPDGAVQTSALNPPDAEYLGARRVTVIPNGLADTALPGDLGPDGSHARRDEKVRILYVGILGESKGVMVLLEAIRILARDREDLTVWFMGQFTSAAFERAARDFCREHGLDSVVSFLGPLAGDSKWDRFRCSDILCFPSFFESESFGNVVVEAMMFGLPVVATHWRGIPDVVDDGVTGLLVPARDAAALAAALHRLTQDSDLRRALGSAGRKKYVGEFTIDRHLERLEMFLWEVASGEYNSSPPAIAEVVRIHSECTCLPRMEGLGPNSPCSSA